MKLKSLLVITLIVLGCSSAFAGTYAFGFLDYTGGVEYCNYEEFVTGGADNFYMAGFDVLDVCASANATAPIEGEAITVPATALESNGLQKGIQGKGYVYADQLYDAYYGYYTGAQWLVNTKTAVNTVGKVPNKPGKWNWDGFEGFSGEEFLINYGFLTTTIPDARSKSTGSTVAGSLQKAHSNTLRSALK
ncbi:MAG: hypothetical protein WBD45_17200 [Terriglobales bacterium]